MSETNKTRADGKAPNNKKDDALIADIKALYQRGLPAGLISKLYNVAESTVYMVGAEHRRKSVEPTAQKVATQNALARFQSLLNGAQAV